MSTNEGTPNVDESEVNEVAFSRAQQPRYALEEAVLSCLADGAEWLVSELAEECGRPVQQLHGVLRRLESSGLAARGDRLAGAVGRPPDMWRRAT